MPILIWLLLSSVAVFAAAYILPGVQVKSFGTAVIVALILGVLNAFIRPVLILLTLPINVLTLGLFTFVIMAGLALLVSAIVPGFEINGFWWAVGFSVVLTVLNLFLQGMIF